MAKKYVVHGLYRKEYSSLREAKKDAKLYSTCKECCYECEVCSIVSGIPIVEYKNGELI